jgi:hypothetical protein
MVCGSKIKEREERKEEKRKKQLTFKKQHEDK